MSSLTVAILAKNEEAMIERAIASAAFADEVLVVDGGSTDATVTIARRAGARVIERPFDDFARQRNFALDEAAGDWVFFLDADERFTSELSGELRLLMRDGPVADAYAVPRQNLALGRWLSWHLGGSQDMPLRLLRRRTARWSGMVHETVEGAEHVGRLFRPLLHFTHRSVAEVVRKIDYYSELEAADLVRKGARAPTVRAILGSYPKALWRLWRSGLRKEGLVGAIEATLLAFNRTLVLAKVWEKTREEPLEEVYARAERDVSSLDAPVHERIS